MNSSIIATELCRFLLIYCLAAGALSKLIYFREFSHNLTDSFAIAVPLNQSVAAALVIVEACLAICLVTIPEYSNTVSFLCLLLFGFFGVVLLWATQQERNISCQCFGPGDDKVSMIDVWRNAIVIASCLPGIVIDLSKHTHIEPAISLLTASLALPCFLLIVYFKDAVRLLSYQRTF